MTTGVTDLRGWERRERMIAESREIGGVWVDHVIALQGVRLACGCLWSMGMRLDCNETTFGATPCDVHGVQVARAIEAFQRMPPSDKEAGELYEEILEREIEIAP